MAGWTLDAHLSHKRRWNMRPGADDGILEGRLDATRRFGANRLRLRVEATPDNYGSTALSAYAEADLRRTFTQRWSASASLGRREQTGGPDYAAWSVGTTFALREGVEIDLRWRDTSRHDLDDSYDGRVVAALAIAF
jgi:hypothetical protein